MSTEVIKAKDKQSLRRASRLPVEAYFQGLSEAQKKAEWLSPSNRYRIECTQRYWDDLAAQPRTVDDSALIGYISASAPAHVIDGWSTLGRAVDAALRSDTYNAIHLAYYAEMRAAMGLLASEGIGIFNVRHPRASKAGRTVCFSKQATHKLIWPCLQQWAAWSASLDAIERVVRPAQIPLQSWFAAFNVKVPTRAVTRRLFQSWGVDLRAFEDDHDLRNLASYRPSELNLAPTIGISDVFAFISDIWRCFEPSSAGRFGRLEKYLLRRIMLTAKVDTNLVTPVALAALGMPVAEAAEWTQALNTATEPLLFREAMIQTAINDGRCHLQVIARASLLLAVSTAAVRQLLVGAGYTQDHLRFWWERIGQSRGLWDHSVAAIRPEEAWADIRDCIDETTDWFANNAAVSSVNRWRRAQAASVELLGAFELVGIWALMP
jgi:hypothetical protein